jgi:nucleotide-binding universal stress UspA family protein
MPEPLPPVGDSTSPNSRRRRTILVPTGLDAASRRVFEHACELARDWDGELVLLHVVEPDRTRATTATHPAVSPRNGLDALGLLHQAVHQRWPALRGSIVLDNPHGPDPRQPLEEWTRSPAARAVRTTIELKQGSIVDQIVEHARRLRPDVVLLPAESPAPLTRRRWLPGRSRVRSLIDRLDAPILLVRPEREQPPARPPLLTAPTARSLSPA